ncbi:hypothetical protein ACF08M_34360 [Streptomyces sp. NPDC015032]|uniref:hypothetical protein n=1 Tax=Streptomyces sp. NPDC015032 TaxID=3364937 RepID=UPI0036F868E2
MKNLRAAVVTIAAAASLAVVVPSTAQAAADCKSGGQAYICEYGITTQKLPNGTKEVFAVAPDHSVATRWTDSDGDWSHWESLGGYAKSKVVTSHYPTSPPGYFSIHALGADDFYWFRERDTNGNWSAWARNRDPQ